MRVDEDRRPGDYWLTGSQQFRLKHGITESLAGRVAILTLRGFSSREAHRFRTEAPPFLPASDAAEQRGIRDDCAHGALFRDIWTGSFPAPIAGGPIDHDVFMSS